MLRQPISYKSACSLFWGEKEVKQQNKNNQKTPNLSKCLRQLLLFEFLFFDWVMQYMIEVPLKSLETLKDM